MASIRRAVRRSVVALGLQVAVAAWHAPAGAQVTAANNHDWLTFELAGQTGGAVSAVEADGTYAFLAVGPRVVALDVSDPTRPVPVGESAILPNVVQDLALRGRYLYALVGGPPPVSIPSFPADAHSRAVPAARPGSLAQLAVRGVVVLDVADPAHVQQVGALPAADGRESSSQARRLFLDGNRLFIGDGNLGVQIVDITDPTLPRAMGRVDADVRANDLAVLDDHLFAATGDMMIKSACNDGRFGYMDSDLEVFDLAQLSSPRHVGTFPWGTRIASDGGLLFAAGEDALQVLDAQDPANPRQLGSVEIPDGTTRLVAQGGRMYVAGNGGDSLFIVDVSDPATPRRLGEIGLGFDTWDLAISGNHVYVADRQDGLIVVDAAEPALPRVVGRFRPLGQIARLAVVGSDLVTHDTCAIQVASLADPAHPRPIAYHEPNIAASWRIAATDLAVSDDAAFVGLDGYTDGGVVRVDVADPSAPRFTDALTATGAVLSLAVEGRVAYVNGRRWLDKTWGAQLLAADIGEPGSARVLGEVPLPAEWTGTAAIYGTVYGLQQPVGPRTGSEDQRRSLAAVDAHEAGAMRLMNLDTSEVLDVGWHQSLVAKDHYLITGSPYSVLNVAVPARPRLTATLPTGATRARVIGDRLLAMYNIGLHAYDLADPEQPHILGHVDVPVSSSFQGSVIEVDALGDIVYVAAGE